MNLADWVAHLVVRRPWVLITGALALLGACIWIVVSHPRFDSDVLNPLPQNLAEVQALHVYQDEFRQGKELVFAMHGDAQAVADFEDEFVDELRVQPWVERVFSRSPLESPEEIAALQKLVPQLVLNLPASNFDRVMNTLTPTALTERIRKLKSAMESGSPRAETEATVDPTGLVALALEPLGGTAAMEKGQSLISADGTMKLIPVVTRQATLSQADSKATMDQLQAFLASWRAGNKARPAADVTGRSAYVAQIAQAMNRDISVTSTISFCVVTLLFFIGFRRWIPPLGTTLILGFSCFVAFAIGCLFFKNLNLLAISFCSILAGLGDDFSLLLYNRYLLARGQGEEHQRAIATSIRDVGRGILYVSFTTGAGFLALLFSGSSGFAQLGVLIAVGLFFCALLVILLLFLFIRPHHANPERPDPLHVPFEAMVSWILRNRKALGIGMSALAIVATLYAVLPIQPLEFDTNPRSLEPKSIPAAGVLRLINEKIPASAEPITVLIQSDDTKTFYARWHQLDEELAKLVKSGVLASYSSPTGLILSPEQIVRNAASLQAKLDLDASRDAFRAALMEAGFKEESFASAFAIFDALKNPPTDAGSLDLAKELPESSAWWFLIDRYFAPRGLLAAAYLRPANPLQTAEQQLAFDQAIRVSGVPVQITGWSYTMLSLIPWAKREMTLFSIAVTALILLSMALAYRRWKPFLVHTLSLVLGIGACIALLKITGTQINLLNALAFPLVLGVGVDYGMHVLLAMMEEGHLERGLTTVVKPLVISGLTTIAGFGALMFAQNPALKGLGTVCALGVTCCLISSLLLAVPLLAWLMRRE